VNQLATWVLVQQLMNGLAIGIIYGLVAIGYSMIYKSLGQLNFAHADNLTVGAIMGYLCIAKMGLGTIPGFLLVIIGMLSFGLFLERIIFRRFEKGARLTFMLASISTSGLIRNIAVITWGPLPRRLPPIFGTASLNIGSINLHVRSLYILLIAILLLFVLQLFYTKTKFGLALRMAAEDADTASLQGVNVRSTRSATFAITAAMGGIAGLLSAPLFGVTIELGSSMAMKAFIAAVIGGLGNLAAALVTGLFLGVLESIATGYISSAFCNAIIFVTGMLVLSVRPAGLFRRELTKH